MNTAENELHPIIDDVLDEIRKRTETIDGRRVVVEEFVLPEEAIPRLENKLQAITNEEEQKEAVLSIFAFSMMVEKQGWPENARKIKEIAKVAGDVFFQLNSHISSALSDRKKTDVSQFLGDQDLNTPTEEFPTPAVETSTPDYSPPPTNPAINPSSTENPPVDELHPIIDDILDEIRKRTETIDGQREVVEEFVIPEEAIPRLENKLQAITDEEEKREAVLSIFAFSMMVEKQGWPENARKIKEIAKGAGDLYAKLQSRISASSTQKKENIVDQFFGDENQTQLGNVDPTEERFNPWLEE